MSQWTLDIAPRHEPTCDDSPSGWKHPVTGEIIAAIGNLTLKRRNYLDNLQPNNMLLEDGGAFLLEQDIDPERPDWLILDV